MLRGEIKSKFIQIVSASEPNLESFFAQVKERFLDETIFIDTKRGYNYIKKEMNWLSEKIKSQRNLTLNMVYQAVMEVFENGLDIDITRKEGFIDSIQKSKNKKNPSLSDDLPRRLNEWVVFIIGTVIFLGLSFISFLFLRENIVLMIIGIVLSLLIGLAAVFFIYKLFEKLNRNKLKDFITSKINSISASTKKNLNKIINDFENNLVKLIEEESEK